VPASLPTESPEFAAEVGDAAAHVFVESLDDELAVVGEDGHHLQRVRRLRDHERVTASDGRGSWRTYEIVSAGRGRLGLAADGPVTREPQLHPRLTIAFAPAKGAASELVVQKATELGADCLMPVLTRRSVVRNGPSLVRLRRIAREAAAQCRRAWIPEVCDAASLDDLVGHPGLVVADRDGSPADALSEPNGGEWVVVIGPEGGFDPAERAAFAGLPVLAVGPHILRAETAAVAVTAAIAGRRRALRS
jgi:16S rRNA (uracil1498-N3)-methyltransferase